MLRGDWLGFVLGRVEKLGLDKREFLGSVGLVRYR